MQKYIKVSINKWTNLYLLKAFPAQSSLR